MPKGKRFQNALVKDLILSCAGNGVSQESAEKAIRALCHSFGGTMIYIPSRKENGVSAENLRGVLSDAVGDHEADKILFKIMTLYGNMQVYIPMEKKAFKKTIALEIYERCGKDGTSMNDLARDYDISFTFAYSLWELGRYEKLKAAMPYLPFLEMTEKQ